jgi:hypothetical protein
VKKCAPKEQASNENGITEKDTAEYEKSLLIKKLITDCYFEKFPNALRLNPELDWIDKGILFELSTYFTPNNWACFPSIPTIANRIGIKRRNLEGRLKSLKVRGYINWKRGKFSSYYQITEKILSFHYFSEEQLAQNSLKNMIRDAQNLRISRCAEFAHEKPNRDAQNLRITKDSYSKDFKEEDFECDFSDEKSNTTTGSKKKSGGHSWKKKGEGEPHSFSMSVVQDESPPTPPSATKNKSVKNSVGVARSIENKSEGEMDMEWDKNARKGGLRKAAREDNTAGFAHPKIKKSGEEKEGAPPKIKGQKLRKTVQEIEHVFKVKSGLSHKIVTFRDQNLVSAMVERLGLPETKEVIAYACEHWDESKTDPKMGSLSLEPNLNEMIVDWRYIRWSDMMKMESQRIHLPKQELPPMKVGFKLVKS